MNARTNRILARAGLLLAIAASVPSARANLLIDPGFEANPLTTAANVINTPNPMLPGLWGQENSTITGAEYTVVPAQGINMLRMDYIAGYTQTFQATDVTSYAALIDSGGATVNMNALFNANPKIGAALSAVYVSFFTASNNGSQIGSDIGNNLTLDNSPSTWQLNSVSGTIPVGTRWLLSQVAYQGASLQGVLPDTSFYGGYVDAADLTITPTPEPATLCLLGLGALTMIRRRRSAV